MFNSIDIIKLINLFVYDPHNPLLFGTSLFLFLFFGLLVFYRIFANNKNIRIIGVLVFSLFFYYKAAGAFFIILIVSTIFNFYAGKIIASLKTDTTKRLLFLIITLVINLGALGYFKYTNFFLQILNDIHLGKFEPLDIFLPIGISFYTFKALSYVIDIYLETFQPVKSFRDFSLFMFFFPNILIGPIDRAATFIPQIEGDQSITKGDIGKAIFLIMFGLLKKVAVADYISINFVDRVFEVPLRFTGFENLMAAYGYAIQMYCDFSGYTDMALGIALLLGFNLTENFRWPYKATSIADFWRRWHISLSSWLLDYLFRPLQIKFRNVQPIGNIAALMITFIVIGLWHGASWMYIVFGAIHGFYITFSLLTKKIKKKFFELTHLADTKSLKVVQIIITFHLVVFAFIIFRAPDFMTVSNILSQIFNSFHPEVIPQFLSGYTFIFELMAFAMLVHYLPEGWRYKVQEWLSNTPLIGQALILAVVIWIVIQVKSADLQPYLYFKF
jgi:D-alanyl-lipoteichoic acid acyltransferase DltB (MBOAT superfamily)